MENFSRNYAFFYMQGVGIITEITVLTDYSKRQFQNSWSLNVVYVFNYDVVYVIITTITTQKSTIEINKQLIVIVIVIFTVLDSLTVSLSFLPFPSVPEIKSKLWGQLLLFYHAYFVLPPCIIWQCFNHPAPNDIKHLQQNTCDKNGCCSDILSFLSPPACIGHSMGLHFGKYEIYHVYEGRAW